MKPLQSSRKLLKKIQLDAILFSSAPNILYLTNYAGFSETERDAYTLLLENKCYLFTNPLYAQEIKQKTTDFRIIEHDAKRPFIKNLADIVEKEGLSTIGFENDNLTVAEYLRLTENISSHFISVDLTKLRIYKNDTEIENIKKACQIADEALANIKSKVKPGVTELDIALEFELTVRKFGGVLSFPTIVAFGKNAAIPHHHTDQTKLKINDVVLIDCGVKINNYCSDITRTFFIGKPTLEQKKAYQTTFDAQQKAVKYISMLLEQKKEINAAEVDDVAREHITQNGFPSIPHSLGHGIGIQVHEAPPLSPTSKNTLEEGMVFSIEPGIYLTNKFGIRIEDLYAIQNNKLVQLTPSI
ncbi:Xaa-Pro peptidase family protein [soil metagenome]